MSKTVVRFATLGLLLTILHGGTLSEAAPANAETTTRLDTYAAPDGAGYFALRLTPDVALADQGGRDVVVLFDTSASQTGVARVRGLDALTALLKSLTSGDRVALVAVDLEPVALTTGMVSPQGEAMKQAVAALRQRVPLGATDMPAALYAAADAFDGKQSNKALIYIGDGVSSANFLQLEDYRRLIDKLVAERVAMTSYAVGVRVDSALLASLANLTGGMLAIDSESFDPSQAGAYLAAAVRGVVAWPTQVDWPPQFAEIYPTNLPPLRNDRDTIVIGKGVLSGKQAIAVTVAVGNELQSLKWSVTPAEPNADFAFLAPLVDSAATDDGLRLATLGTPGLIEVRRMVIQSSETLAKLGGQAVSAGNLQTAQRLITEALRRDPNDTTALAAQRQLAKLQASGNTGPQAPLEIKRFQSEQAAPPRAEPPAAARAPEPTTVAASGVPAIDPVNDGQGRFLSSIQQQRRLMTAQVKAEVENVLRNARALMASDPAAVEQSVKLTLERVDRVPELPADVRAQLRGQLETALRAANSRAATKDIVDVEIARERAAALDRLSIAQGLVRRSRQAGTVDGPLRLADGRRALYGGRQPGVDRSSRSGPRHVDRQIVGVGRPHDRGA